jgi:ubiquinone/menaquinone biosynthesis C-methylase UbiE
MTQPAISFNDGASYERMMGRWSQIAGLQFVDWLAAPAGLRWLDVGCGNGAFTELVGHACAPSSIDGIDPSEGQLAYARARGLGPQATFMQGNAMALPFADNTFDVAIMALVMFFVPQPAKAVAEMARVVRSGGTVASYTWDTTRGGFPQEALQDEMKALGVKPNMPPSAHASRMEVLVELYEGAGLTDIETREITVYRTFADFDDFWSISMSSNAGAQVADMKPEDVATLKARLRKRLPRDRSGRIAYSARANAIKARVAR